MARPLPVVPQRRERRADGEPQVPGGERGGVRADDPHPEVRRQRGPLLPGRHLRTHTGMIFNTDGVPVIC
ncbi:hypothetical protein JOQ06_010508 [Pogonophryne albipinna]|uniref:Uncharacterized protein n=1 Tax=Pogonophryne albipinna TaxID=1090488 RepID=A0AAD6FEQ0_9TELE|nr:hypothetical protein JOQ06_010508 [Pogonophryne albipinna]